MGGMGWVGNEEDAKKERGIPAVWVVLKRCTCASYCLMNKLCRTNSSTEYWHCAARRGRAVAAKIAQRQTMEFIYGIQGFTDTEERERCLIQGVS